MKSELLHAHAFRTRIHTRTRSYTHSCTHTCSSSGRWEISSSESVSDLTLWYRSKASVRRSKDQKFGKKYCSSCAKPSESSQQSYSKQGSESCNRTFYRTVLICRVSYRRKIFIIKDQFQSPAFAKAILSSWNNHMKNHGYSIISTSIYFPNFIRTCNSRFCSFRMIN